MSKKRVNHSWSEGLAPGSQPVGPTEFEQIAARLQLKPDEYAASAKLRDWVEKNWRQKFVPEKLLKVWRLSERGLPDVD